MVYRNNIDYINQSCSLDNYYMWIINSESNTDYFKYKENMTDVSFFRKEISGTFTGTFVEGQPYGIQNISSEFDTIDHYKCIHSPYFDNFKNTKMASVNLNVTSSNRFRNININGGSAGEGIVDGKIVDKLIYILIIKDITIYLMQMMNMVNGIA